jgi:cytochrome c peroxidase
MKRISAALLLSACAPLVLAASPLGLPPVPVPDNNPLTPEKIALGDRLFHDERFSSTGDVSCATCHDREKAFTDSPLVKSEGIQGLTGTRSAPTVANAAFFSLQFWDGRSPDLEDQALHPFVNPIEMGLPDHEPILAIVRSDPEYMQQFGAAFGVAPEAVTMTEVTQAIASFQRTLVFGDSPFDRWYFGGDESAVSAQVKRGFELFVDKARCQSCHAIEQDFALFTDNRFHNIGVGINTIQDDIPTLAPEFVLRKATGVDVDVAVLTDERVSELGRFAITDTLDEIGAFKTSTLRNIAVTAPYMHDGSIATLRDVVVHYNNGGVTNEGDRVNDFLAGGIRPLDLGDDEIDDVVAFMEALTSPEFAHLQGQQAAGADKAKIKGATDPRQARQGRTRQ